MFRNSTAFQTSPTFTCYPAQVSSRAREVTVLEDPAVDLVVVDGGQGYMFVASGARRVAYVLVDVFGCFFVWEVCVGGEE